MSNRETKSAGVTRIRVGLRGSDNVVRPGEVSRILRMIRPSFKRKGGNVELVGVKGREVVVRLSGACERCPISFEESSGVVERIIRSRVPAIEQLTIV